MGFGVDMPKGNVYNSGDFSSAPVFPLYMEGIHSKWIGFVPPIKTTYPKPYFKLENGDQEPSLGLEYILVPYRDRERTIAITYAEAWENWTGVLKPDGFDAEPVTTKAGYYKGIKVTRIYPCTYTRNLTFRLEPNKKKIKYYEMKSVTETMNSVFHKVILEQDRFDHVRSVFQSLLDIRTLENVNVQNQA